VLFRQHKEIANAFQLTDSSNMNRHRLLTISILAILLVSCNTQAQQPSYFSGFYGGLEGGAISYNTQITFDGVDDPAGRGGGGYGLVFGYNHEHKKLVIGAELLFNLASTPDPYTFDPAVTGFSDLDLRRGASFGLDLRAGYLVIKRILLYGSLGFSRNKQSVRIDGTPLNQFSGGADDVQFGSVQFALGLEVAIYRKVSIRSYFRTLDGYDLNVTDFGTIITDVSLSHFDVEPVQQQFFTGLIFRL